MQYPVRKWRLVLVDKVDPVSAVDRREKARNHRDC